MSFMGTLLTGRVSRLDAAEIAHFDRAARSRTIIGS